MSAPSCRGYMVLSCIDYIEKAYDAEKRDRIFKSVSEEVRSHIGRYNQVEWYPREHCGQLFRAIASAERTEQESYEALVRCGKTIGENATKGYLKLLMKILTPGLFARKVGDFWARDHRGGVLSADAADVEKNRLTARLTDIEGYDCVAPTAVGFMTHALEGMGKRDVHCDLEGWSLANAAPREVVYKFRWK